MRRRARAIALPRRRNQPPWLPWLVLLAAGLGIAAFDTASAAPADEAQPGATPALPTQDNGTAKPPGPVATSRSGGVLKPKGNPDPGITLPTPNPKQFPTPVIKPPGTRGGNPQVVPK